MNITFTEKNDQAFVGTRMETTSLVSKMAYLTGVERRIFENPNEPFCLEIYRELDGKQNARIIRNLCMIRTKLELNFGFINHAMRYELKNLDAMPEYIPAECLKSLEQDGISLVRANRKTTQYIIDVNSLITQRISSCRELLPDWLNWNYVRQMFIMPKGTTEQGIKQAAAVYYTHKQCYPYQVYLNWTPSEQGNIFYNDRKFVTVLYAQHGDTFRDVNRVSDAAEGTKDALPRFLMDAGKAIMVVDCENADPCRFHGMLESLRKSASMAQVSKIVLYNDIHASTAWKMLNRFANLPVEHHMTARVKADKSIVDPQLITGVCREHYENGVDSVILVSSDCDYCGMIAMLPQVRFFVMAEQRKFSPDTRAALEQMGATYCSMDTFSAADNGFMTAVLLGEVRQAIIRTMGFNVRTMLDQACHSARVEPSEAEKQQFFDRYLRSMRISFAADGQPVLQNV